MVQCLQCLEAACPKCGSKIGSMFGDNSLSYYCMSCGTKHKAACPKRGSKMKRVGS